MPAFDPSYSMFPPQSSGSFPQNNPSVPGLGNAFGVPPEVLERLRMLLMQQQSGSPQQADVLRRQLLQVPGVRERLMKMQNPQNPNVQQIAPPPPGMMAGSMPTTIAPPRPGDPGAMQGGEAQPPIGWQQPQPAPTGEIGPPGTGTAPPPPGLTAQPTQPIGPPATGQAPPNQPGQNPNRFKGRLKHGKGLPPGQRKVAAGSPAAQTGWTPPPGGVPGYNQGNEPRPIGPKPGPSYGNDALPQPVPPSLPSAPPGGGFMDYRTRRMSGGSGRPVY